MAIAQVVKNWSMTDTLATRTGDISGVLSSQVFTSGQNMAANLDIWNTLSGALPPEMTLEELLQFLAADTESDQRAILDMLRERIEGSSDEPAGPVQKRIRILTMHGGKGLSGKVVFIPSAEQGIMPNFKALQATGLLIEQRRLFYVSLTRSMACCIFSHVAQRTGAAARALTQKPVARLSRSQFLTEMGLSSIPRINGLTPPEALAILNDINAL